jgi:large subunit ribosomal protein L22
MEITASTQEIRISPRKVRLVADTIRKMSLEQALLSLKLIRKRGASVLEKTLLSAVANAVNNKQIDRADLKIAKIEVTDGPALKRYHASTRGRIHPYKRRSSNVVIVLQEVKNGTKS